MKECRSSIYGVKGDDMELSDVELNDVELNDVELNDVVNVVWCNK